MARVPDAVQRQQEEMDAFDAEVAQAQPVAETPPTPEAPPEPVAAPPAPDPTAVDWQQKFQTLQGKYNAEVPQLRTQVQNLSKQLEDLKAAPTPATPEPAPAAAPPAPAKLITPEDAETYGDDLIDLIRRVAVETDAGEKAKLQGEIADLRRQMAANVKQVEDVAVNVADERRANYFTELAKLCPTYEETDASDAFKTWLLQPDEFSGLIRNDILQQAFAAFDAVRTAKVFNTYLSLATPEPAPVTPPPPPNPQDELAQQVSPGQARTTPVLTPDDGKKVWSIDEVDELYKAVGRGEYRGRTDEWARIEAEIDRALLEDRVH